jgi:hypothetical protein
MMKASLLLLLTAASTTLRLGLADRDPNYYGPYSNPNLAYSHYWVDASNVLSDLSSFSALYVMFHSCA